MSASRTLACRQAHCAGVQDCMHAEPLPAPWQGEPHRTNQWHSQADQHKPSTQLDEHADPAQCANHVQLGQLLGTCTAVSTAASSQTWTLQNGCTSSCWQQHLHAGRRTVLGCRTPAVHERMHQRKCGDQHRVLTMHLEVEPQRPRPVTLVSLYQAGLGVLGSASLARVTACMCMSSTNTV
jgi:hypothetical protein